MIYIVALKKKLTSSSVLRQPRGIEGNQQCRVGSLFRGIKGYELISRQQYWLRRGYALEIWGPTLEQELT